MSQNRIRYRHLQCFLAIAQLKSVRAAAEVLAVTQPAMSKTLRELENELGIKLFTRDKTGMLLTRFGDIFLRHAAGSMTSLRAGIDEINFAKGAGSFTKSGDAKLYIGPGGPTPKAGRALLPAPTRTYLA